MRAVKALLFDVFGTVVDWRNGVARDAAVFLDARGRSDIDPAAFADAWRARYQPAMKAVREGGRSFVRLDVLHRENLMTVLDEFGIDPAPIPESELDQLNRSWHRLDPWSDSVAGLARLKQRYIIAPMSNGNIALMLNLAKRAGLPWDAILGAEVVQAYKPSPESYNRTAEVLGLPSAAICLVAAHNNDLAAARQCGWRTAFVPRPTEDGPNQKRNLTAEQDWDVVARDMNHLAAQLGL